VDDDEELPDIDIRSLTVIWNEEDDRPEIAFSGCSIYEALGLAVTAAFRLLMTEAHTELDDDLEDEE
jgi:hypothetical protein